MAREGAGQRGREAGLVDGAEAEGPEAAGRDRGRGQLLGCVRRFICNSPRGLHAMPGSLNRAHGTGAPTWRGRRRRRDAPPPPAPPMLLMPRASTDVFRRSRSNALLASSELV